MDRIQGRPGGVGLVDCTYWLGDSRTRSNHGQPKPNDHNQLTVLLGSCAKSLGIQYDWVGIAEDACAALDLTDLCAAIDPLWRWPSQHDLLPGHVVCSSLAAMLYDLPQVGYTHPDLGQGATGADVRSVQGLLTARNHSTAIDGIFGPNTNANVRAFQTANGLTADGIVGPNTWPKLLNV